MEEPSKLGSLAPQIDPFAIVLTLFVIVLMIARLPPFPLTLVSATARYCDSGDHYSAVALTFLMSKYLWVIVVPGL